MTNRATIQNALNIYENHFINELNETDPNKKGQVWHLDEMLHTITEAQTALDLIDVDDTEIAGAFMDYLNRLITSTKLKHHEASTKNHRGRVWHYEKMLKTLGALQTRIENIGGY